MAEKCPVCGKKVGGILVVGVDRASPERKEFCKKNGITFVEGTCRGCLEVKIANFFEEIKEDKQQSIEERDRKFENIIKSIFISPSSFSTDTQDLGLVTGYCIMGTGPISAIASSITDIFGQKSNAYLEKVRLAEAEALNMLKVEALKKRADAVYNVRVNLTEATSGHGMLMVSASGAAVNTGKNDKDFEDAWRLMSESTYQE